MGTPEGQKTGSQVYYDPEQGQYYTVNQPEQRGYNYNPVGSMFGNAFGLDKKNRNYITMPSQASADRFTPNSIQPNYPDMGELFPMLDAGIVQNLQQSLLAPADAESSGAGRFLAPSNTSKGK